MKLVLISLASLLVLQPTRAFALKVAQTQTCIQADLDRAPRLKTWQELMRFKLATPTSALAELKIAQSDGDTGSVKKITAFLAIAKSCADLEARLITLYQKEILRLQSRDENTATKMFWADLLRLNFLTADEFERHKDFIQKTLVKNGLTTAAATIRPKHVGIAASILTDDAMSWFSPNIGQTVRLSAEKANPALSARMLTTMDSNEIEAEFDRRLDAMTADDVETAVIRHVAREIIAEWRKAGVSMTEPREKN